MLVIDPLEFADSGSYAVVYDDGAKSVASLGPTTITVVAPNSLPLSRKVLVIAVFVIGILSAFPRVRRVDSRRA